MDTTSYQQYTVKFNPDDVPTLYADWTWLVNPEDFKNALLMTAFGDLFFKTVDGAVYFLDTLEGAVIPFVKNEADFETKLADTEVQKHFLSVDAVEVLKARNLILKDNELYIYVPHPLVAKAIVLDSVQAMSMNVVISLGGQLLKQMYNR